MLYSSYDNSKGPLTLNGVTREVIEMHFQKLQPKCYTVHMITLEVPLTLAWPSKRAFAYVSNVHYIDLSEWLIEYDKLAFPRNF